MNLYRKLLCFSLGFMVVSPAFALCTKPAPTNVADSNATPINIPNFNISNAHLQPYGAVLGSTVVPSTLTPLTALKADTVIWECDETDLPNIYFLVATNGDSTFNGFHQVGLEEGLEDVYTTFWLNVGVRHTMAGVNVSRYYRSVPISSYKQVGSKIQIRLMDVPPVEVTLFKVSKVINRLDGGLTALCEYQAISGTYKSGVVPHTSTRFFCNQPSIYVQLAGNSDAKFLLYTPDKIGEDSSRRFNFWGANYGFAYGFYNSSTVATNSPACVARSVTPTVNFQPISAVALRNGAKTETDFNVELECDSVGVQSGTAAGNFAIGFQPSMGAYDAAQSLNLLNANGSARYLVSDNYNSEDLLAKGVGIQLKNPSTQTAMHFLNKTAAAGGGSAAAWYPVLEGTPTNLGSVNGFTKFLQKYTAILTALPGQEVVPGKVKATATVVVKIQ